LHEIGEVGKWNPLSATYSLNNKCIGVDTISLRSAAGAAT